MANSWFQFKDFRLDQDRCAMKISTDAVLLGALVNGKNPQKILDIGTGTGVIALMLAQRFREAKIDAIELDPPAARQAFENFSQSPFSAQLVLLEGRFQDFSFLEKFDLMVSNPPYFHGHLKSYDAQRNLALHSEGLSFAELGQGVARFLKTDGIFWVILPPRQMQDLEKILAGYSIFPIWKFTIQDNPNKPVMREVLGFGWEKKKSLVGSIFIKEQSGEFHASYKALVSSFLLNF